MHVWTQLCGWVLNGWDGWPNISVWLLWYGVQVSVWGACTFPCMLERARLPPLTTISFYGLFFSPWPKLRTRKAAAAVGPFRACCPPGACPRPAGHTRTHPPRHAASAVEKAGLDKQAAPQSKNYLLKSKIIDWEKKDKCKQPHEQLA